MTQENTTTVKKTKVSYRRILLVVLFVILGFLAGVCGELFARIYLANTQFFRDLYFTESTDLGQREIVINDPKKVVVEQDLRVYQLKNETEPKIVGIYNKKSSPVTILDKVLLPGDYVGEAVILTSDGWLITALDLGAKAKTDLVAVSNDKKIYNIQNLVYDSQAGVYFIKIEAQNLPVLKFADTKQITNGQQVILYENYFDQLVLANIEDRNYRDIKTKYDLVNNSQNLDKKILLNKTFKASFASAPLFNFQGELLAFLINDSEIINKAIPINYINSIIGQVLKGEEIKRPYLGINYLDLSQISGLSPEERQNLDSGAMLWPDKKGLAVAADSPLVSVLEKGDIITALEGQKLDKENDLKDLILEYQSGQEIHLNYQRKGEEKEVNVVLK